MRSVATRHSSRESSAGGRIGARVGGSNDRVLLRGAETGLRDSSVRRHVNEIAHLPKFETEHQARIGNPNSAPGDERVLPGDHSELMRLTVRNAVPAAAWILGLPARLDRR